MAHEDEHTPYIQESQYSSTLSHRATAPCPTRARRNRTIRIPDPWPQDTHSPTLDSTGLPSKVHDGRSRQTTVSPSQTRLSMALVCLDPLTPLFTDRSCSAIHHRRAPGDEQRDATSHRCAPTPRGQARGALPHATGLGSWRAAPVPRCRSAAIGRPPAARWRADAPVASHK